MTSIFKKPKPPPPAPAPKAMPVAPGPDNAAARKVSRKAIAASRKRGGRASTILSDKESLG